MIPKSIKIKEIKINLKFAKIVSKIAMLKEEEENEKAKNLKITYAKEINGLKLDAIQPDFALSSSNKAL